MCGSQWFNASSWCAWIYVKLKLMYEFWSLWCLNFEVLDVLISRVPTACFWGFWCHKFELLLLHTCCSSLKPDTDVDATRKSTLKTASKVDFSMPGDPDAPAVKGEAQEASPENQGAQKRCFHLPSSFAWQNARDRSLILSKHWYMSFQC